MTFKKYTYILGLESVFGSPFATVQKCASKTPELNGAVR
jgi:hypothetical protein